jgi:hypothetical protein
MSPSSWKVDLSATTTGAIRYNPIYELWRYTQTGQTSFWEDYLTLQAAYEFGLTFKPILDKILQDQEAFIQAYLSGNDAAVGQIAEEYRPAAEFIAEVIEAIKDQVAGMDCEGYSISRASHKGKQAQTTKSLSDRCRADDRPCGVPGKRQVPGGLRRSGHSTGAGNRGRVANASHAGAHAQ